MENSVTLRKSFKNSSETWHQQQHQLKFARIYLLALQCLSVRPSACNKLRTTERIFMKFGTAEF
jgi:hypothetical protein